MQKRVFDVHRRACQRLGIPQVTLEHRGLAGSTTTNTTSGNVRYRGRGATTALDSDTTTTTAVWWITQYFLRGEQKPAEEGMGIVEAPIKLSQIPAIDDSGNFVAVSEHDLVLDGHGRRWRVMDPVLDPAETFYTFMAEALR